MTPHEIYLEARRLGFELQPRGDKLAVIPAGKCPPEFREVLVANKASILAWLASPEDQLALGKYSPNEFDDVLQSYPPHDRNQPGNPSKRTADKRSPWIHVARQVLAGEFDAADGSTRESLTIGLRSLDHTSARRALDRLRLTRGGV